MQTAGVHSIERRRLQEQTRLDSLKTAPERNKWGQFATSPDLARSIVRYAGDLPGECPVRFLEPAVGTGSFFPAVCETFRHESIQAAAGIELTLGDIFAIKRGLATGANRFFVLDETAIRNWQVPRCFLKPILPGPRHLTSDVVGALPYGAPDVPPRLYLLDCNEPEDRLQEAWPRFYEYLQPAGAVLVYLYGPEPRAPVALYLEPIPGDCPQRLPHALSARPIARHVGEASRTCSACICSSAVDRAGATPRRGPGLRGMSLQGRAERTRADSRPPGARPSRDPCADRAANALGVYLAASGRQRSSKPSRQASPLIAPSPQFPLYSLLALRGATSWT